LCTTTQYSGTEESKIKAGIYRTSILYWRISFSSCLKNRRVFGKQKFWKSGAARLIQKYKQNIIFLGDFMEIENLRKLQKEYME
jgi:hypothetical protein